MTVGLSGEEKMKKFLSLREKILKTFIVTIREVNEHGGVEAFFKNYPVGGIFYSEGKILNEEAGSAMSFETLRQCKKAAGNNLLVCADGVSVAGQKNKFRPQKSLGSSRNLQDAYNLGKCIGMQCNDKGVDLVFAPCIDMYRNPLMFLNATSDDPETTSKIYRQVIKGIQDQGVCATAKHFPGMGTDYVNMHVAPGANDLPFDEWTESYGHNFKEMIEEGVSCIMTTHCTLKSYATERENGFNPICTYSHKLTTGLLKGELGFKGAVVTDALVMGGMVTGDLVADTVQAFKAGADLLLWPPIETAEKIEELILSGEIPMSRLDDALARIESLKSVKERAMKNGTKENPSAEFVDKQILEIAKHGICLLRNDINLLPIDSKKRKKILIIDGSENGNGSASILLKDEFEHRGFIADVKRDIYDVQSNVCWQSDIDKLQIEYDLVIFSMQCAFVAEWSVAHMLIWASHMFNKKKKIIVNYGSPYFANTCFPEDPTYIEMNCVPCADTVKMLVDGLTGEAEFEGNSVFIHKAD